MEVRVLQCMCVFVRVSLMERGLEVVRVKILMGGTEEKEAYADDVEQSKGKSIRISHSGSNLHTVIGS